MTSESRSRLRRKNPVPGMLTRKFRRSALSLALSLTLLAPASAFALTTAQAHSASGEPLLTIDFYDEGDVFTPPDPVKGDQATDPVTSKGTLSADQKNSVEMALNYALGYVTQGKTYASEGRMAVYVEHDDNASSFYIKGSENADGTYNSPIFDLVSKDQLTRGVQILFEADNASDIATPTPYLYPIIEEAGTVFAPVIVHELGHSLGIIAPNEGITTAETLSTDLIWFDKSNLTPFASHLYSCMVWDEAAQLFRPDPTVPGVRAAAGTVITLTPSPYRTDELRETITPTPEDSGKFLVSAYNTSGVYFRGPHVSEVLNGAFSNSIPVNGYQDYFYEDYGITLFYAELSHLELERSLMSHQRYRNYTMLLEAELAVLQDIGYDIDRSLFYGHSIYNDGLTVTNQYGYSHGTTLGIGLHVFGSGNTVTQAAPIAASGEAAVGIRNDGSGNTIYVPAGTTVSSSGVHGIGLLFAYGKDNRLIQSGTVSAPGEGGIGVRFDFGHNAIADFYGYRGSFIHYVAGENQPVTGLWNGYPLNLDGPLIRSYDLSGSLSGSDAAIYIGENALVSAINILRGASITGDIISDWNPDLTLETSEGETLSVVNKAATEEAGVPLYTDLNFGYRTASDGSADTSSADPDFNLTYNDSISGPETIRLNVIGGNLTLTGKSDVYSIRNDATLTLGTPASVAATTTFTNSDNATLVTPITADGTLGVIATEEAGSSLQGTWCLTPPETYYRTGTAITARHSAVTLNGGNLEWEGTIAAYTRSPTLTLRVTGSRATPTITVERPSDAYSQYGTSPAARGAGSGVLALASAAEGDTQTLIRTIDYLPNGAAVDAALSQLSAETYNAAADAELRSMSAANTALFTRVHASTLEAKANLAASDSVAASGFPISQWTGYAMPFASRTLRHGLSGHADYRGSAAGILSGIERNAGDGLTWGLDAGLIGRHTSLHQNHNDRVNSAGFSVGTHAFYSPDAWNGFYIAGAVRVGFDENHSKRRVAISDFRRTAKGHYTSVGASGLAALGKDFYAGNVSFGPIVTAEYGVTHREGFTERGGDSVNLRIKGGSEDTFATTVGGHLSGFSRTQTGLRLAADLTAGWKHEFTRSGYTTTATFAGYPGTEFETRTERGARDGFVIQGTASLQSPGRRVLANLTSGYAHDTGFNVGFEAGFRF